MANNLTVTSRSWYYVVFNNGFIHDGFRRYKVTIKLVGRGKDRSTSRQDSIITITGRHYRKSINKIDADELGEQIHAWELKVETAARMSGFNSLRIMEER
jgi:hypothetical protein